MSCVTIVICPMSTDQFRPPLRPVLDKPLRMCVTDVFKAVGAGVAVAGTIQAGSIQAGDRVLAIPSNQSAVVKCTCILQSDILLVVDLEIVYEFVTACLSKLLFFRCMVLFGQRTRNASWLRSYLFALEGLIVCRPQGIRNSIETLTLSCALILQM